MYHEIGIEKLSHAQILKLLGGKKIRVKHGSHHKIHVSEAQHKKIMTAHRKGAGCELQFDPYQIDNHQHIRHGGVMRPIEGHGFLGDMAKKGVKMIAPHAIKAGTHLLKYGIDQGANALNNKIEGWGPHHPHHPEHHLHHHHHAHHEAEKHGGYSFFSNPVGIPFTGRAYNPINVSYKFPKTTPMNNPIKNAENQFGEKVLLPMANPLMREFQALKRFGWGEAEGIHHKKKAGRPKNHEHHEHHEHGGALFPAGYDGFTSDRKHGSGVGKAVAKSHSKGKRGRGLNFDCEVGEGKTTHKGKRGRGPIGGVLGSLLRDPINKLTKSKLGDLAPVIGSAFFPY